MECVKTYLANIGTAKVLAERAEWLEEIGAQEWLPDTSKGGNNVLQ